MFYEVTCTVEGCYAHTDGCLGGGYKFHGAPVEEIKKDWERHHPEHPIEVKEITLEEYSGRWPLPGSDEEAI